MENNIRVLLIDDDQDQYLLLRAMFAELPGLAARYALKWARGYDEAIHLCDEQPFDLYLVDYYLGRHTGLEVMQALRERGCSAPFILLTGQGSYELDLIAMQHGVADYLSKDQLNAYLLERAIRYALERQSIQEELERLVTERTAALRQSEARFRSLTETTSAAIFILQGQMVRYANPAARFVTGYSPTELEGTELWRIAHPAYQELLRQGPAAGWAAGLPLRYEIKIIHRTGQERWLDVTAGQVTFDGAPARLLTAFDITERDRAERELRQMKENLERLVTERTEAARASELEAHQRAEELDGLQRATFTLLATLDLDAMFHQILAAAQSAIPAADKALLCLLRADNELAPPVALLGYDDTTTPSEPAPDASAARCMAQAVRERRSVLLTVGENGQPERGSWIASPLVVEDQVLGALALGSDHPQALQSANLRLLAAFAAAAAAALQNAMLHNEMKLLAENDPLTGPYNRRAFLDLGEKALWRARRAGLPVTAMMIDLDDFKQVNDSLGHETGDRILSAVADCCRSRIREGDIFGRYGGDEFAILLPGVTVETALAIATRILELVSALPFEIPHRGTQGVSLSLGVASDRPDLPNLSALLKAADRAMYLAKQRGKGQVQMAQPIYTI